MVKDEKLTQREAQELASLIHKEIFLITWHNETKRTTVPSEASELLF